MQLNKIILFFFFFIAFEQSYSQQIKYYDSFIDYSNVHRMGWNIDGTKIQEKGFKIKIPYQFRSEIISSGTSNAFYRILKFNNKEKIVIIYRPNAKDKKIINNFNIGRYDFESICEQENILEILKEFNVRLKNKRSFGIKKIEGIGLYVLYLNIKTDEVDKFNYAVNSITILSD